MIKIEEVDNREEIREAGLEKVSSCNIRIIVLFFVKNAGGLLIMF